MTGEDEHLEMAYEDANGGAYEGPDMDDWEDDEEDSQDEVDRAFEDAQYILTHDDGS